MKGDLTGILRFRIIGYQEMLSFLISRQLMSFALRLIKKIELKTLTDFLFFFFVWLGSFIASHPEKHVGDSSVLPGTVELQWQVTSLQELKWSSHFTYKALSKSMRLVHTVSQTVVKWYSRVDIVHWCASWVGKWSSFSTWYVKMYELTSSEGQEQQVSVNIAEKRSSI